MKHVWNTERGNEKMNSSIGLVYDSARIYISREWYQIGNNHHPVADNDKSESVAFKFVSYWVSFNALYAVEKKKEEMSEREQIEAFIRNNEARLTGLFRYSMDGSIQIFLERPVLYGTDMPDGGMYSPDRKYNELECKHKNEFALWRDLNESVEKYKEIDALVYLIQTIYTVRNNLFHGHKTPYPSRNYQLVDCSQQIMRKLLERLSRLE